MKKIVAFLLAAVMVLSMLPMTVFAEKPVYNITNGRPEEQKEINGGFIDCVEKAQVGETVYFLVEPNDGYMVKPDSVRCLDEESSKFINTTDEGGGTYSFVMPEADVTVSAIFMEERTAVSEIDIAVKSFTRDNLKNPPADIASIKSITEGNEDVLCDPAYYVFCDKDKKPIYGYNVAEKVWNDITGEPLGTEPDYDKIGYAMVLVECGREIRSRVKGDFAKDVTVKVNGETISEITNMDFKTGYILEETDLLQVDVMFDLNAKATDEVKAATNVPAGDATNMTLMVVVLAICVMGVALCYPFIKKKVS